MKYYLLIFFISCNLCAFAQDTTRPVKKYKDVDEYVKQNTIYPPDAKKAKLTGSVTVEAVVDTSGKIKNPHITKSLSSSCDKEALRLANSLPPLKQSLYKGKTQEGMIIFSVHFPPK